MNYATEDFWPAQRNSRECAKADGFDFISLYQPIDIHPNFYKEHKLILDQKRGAGCCLWKPYFILDRFSKMTDGDLLIYMDSSDHFNPGLRQFVENNLNNEEQFFVETVHPNRIYTRRNCFRGMKCDEPIYWNHNQLEAGCIGLKKTENNMALVFEWMRYGTMPEIMIDEGVKETEEGNFPDYRRHSCDQSILTNLVIKYNLRTTSIHQILKYVEYNKYG